MALTSTLFTGLSGLDVNQTRLNVIGNNIANVNSVAFKSSRVNAKPQFYITDTGGSPPTGDFGGSNPSQHGLGANVASIEKDFSGGQLQPTGKPTDLGIEGEGFFVTKGSDQHYTRDGSFSLNENHDLVTDGGEFVQGYSADTEGNVIPGVLSKITVPLGATTTAKASSKASLKGNLNASGVVGSGASIITSQLITTSGHAAIVPSGASATLLTDVRSTTDLATPLFAAGQKITLSGKKGERDIPDATFTVTTSSTVEDLTKFVQQATGINPLPDDGDPATPLAGVTLEADTTDAASSRLAIVGNMGTENALTLSAASLADATGATPFTLADGTNAAGLSSDPNGESVHTSFVAYDSLGNPLTIGLTAVFESSSDSGNVWRFFAEAPADTDTDLTIGTGTLTFDNQGKLLSSTGSAITIDRSNTGAKTPLSVNLDFSQMTSLDSSESELVMTSQDGSGIGTLTSFGIGENGIITGNFSNGLTRNIGQLALATFSNPEGLVDNGSNLFSAGPSSGEAIIGTPLSLGAGSVRSGTLELSNVDLSEEFINMIIASTGFSAASRVITTSDQLITELLNSSR